MTTDIAAYCRDVEGHLCRKNGGHLIRIVGPAFDLVKGWADLGIPLSVVYDGIDRTLERAARTTRRRRPVPIAFCEGDVLDGFDRWRRAVGVGASTPVGRDSAARRGTLAAHVERVSAHLVAWASDRPDTPLRDVVQQVVGDVALLGTASATARGAARDAVIARLADLDRALVGAGEAALGVTRVDALTREVEHELGEFRERLAPAQWTAAVATARARAVRREVGLPAVSFD